MLISICFFFFFFFSSRRRHTRCSRDWSSDVCSSDLCPSRRSHARSLPRASLAARSRPRRGCPAPCGRAHPPRATRSEEHTSELQSRLHLVCRLLLEKKKTTEQRRP